MSKVAKATIGLMLATIIAKVLGFGRELVLAAVYGASMYSYAYLTAMNIPSSTIHYYRDNIRYSTYTYVF